MQQLLSDTVQGQINKIKDSWQQALNDIGKSSQGTIRNITNLILNIVKNWRVWLSVIEATTAAFITFKAANITRALLSISYASNQASKSTLRLAQGLKSLFTGFKGNLPSLAIGAVVAGITAYITLKRRMDDYNKEIDNQTVILYDAQQKMLDYQKRVEQNNAVLKDSASSEEKLKFAREDNLAVLSSLQSEYPELYAQVKQMKNGEVELTEKIEAHNESLREQIRLNELLKQKRIADDPFEKDTREYFEQLDKWRKEIIKTQQELKLKLARKELNKDEVPFVERILGIDTDNILVAVRQYNDIVASAKDMISKSEEELREQLTDEIKALNDAWSLATNMKDKQDLTAEIDRRRYKLDATQLRAEALKEYGLENIASYKIINTDIHDTEEFAKESEKIIKELIDSFELAVRQIPEENEKINNEYESFAEYFGKNSGRLLEMVTTNTMDVNETIRTFLEKNGLALTDENKKVWNILLNQALLGEDKVKEILDLYEKAWAEKDPLLKNMYLYQAEQVEGGLYDFFASFKSLSNGDGDDDDKNKTYKSLDELLSLLKTMNSEYNKLSKSAYGFAKSNEIVMKVFRESFKDIFKTTKGMNELDKVLTMINFDTLDITSKQGLANAFQELYDFLEKNSLWNLFGKDADKLRAKLQKTIDMQEVEIGVDVQVKLREDFGKEMEKMFSDYDLTLDLKKLELPADELTGIFDFNYTTLDMLRKKVDEFYKPKIEAQEDPTDLVKQMEGYYKKIDEMEKKELRERLKTYTKYLTEGRNEALKIHLEELKKMAEIDELYAKGHYTDTEYKNISNAIRKETNEKLAKNDWEQFKKSDFYITMFEDLEKVSSESIDIMIERLKSLRKSIGDLHPKQVKEVVRALEKLEKVKLQRSPLKSFAKDLKDAMEWRRESDNLAKELETRSKNVEDLTKQQEFQSQVVADLRAEYDKLAENGESEDAENTKIVLEAEEEVLSDINEQLENEQNNLDNVNQKYNEGYAAQQRVYEGIVKGTQHFNEMASAASTISSEVMDMFDGVSDASKQLAKDIAEIATNVGLLAGDIAKAIASEGTDVSSMIDGVLRTWYIIKGIFSASEHEINWTIEKNTEALQDLETQLDRVKRARDRAWDAHDIVVAEQKIENTIYEQITAYDNLIAAEEDRKNKDEDKIRGWKNERQELFDQLEEERENLLKEFGGVGGQSEFKDMAQGFVDAWKSAFMETGDGLQGLQDHFDEFLNEWFVKQATMRISSKMLEPLFRQIDNAVDQYGGGGTDVLVSELQAVKEKFGAIAPQLSDALERLAGMWGLEGEGGLSGLAAGIQGMTEEQANILEAYWNSVRGFTASIDTNVARIVDLMSGGAGGRNVDTNPQLQQMELIARNTAAIQSLLGSVIKSGHSKGGQGVKVFMD